MDRTSEQSRVVCSSCLLTIDGFATLDVEGAVGNSLSIKTFFPGVGVEWDGVWNWLCRPGSSQTQEICLPEC